VFEGIDTALTKDPEYTWNLLDVLAASSYPHLLFGRRLLVLVRTHDPRLRIAQVGSHIVGWNAREWSNRARGP
jgi:hypothetical protein